MAIRSKKFERVKKRREYSPKFLRFIKAISKNPVRIAALATAAMTFGGFWGANAACIRLEEKLGESVGESESYNSNVSKLTLDMYEQLCIYSACYLKNVNDDWQFTGPKNLMEDFLYYLDYNDYSYKQTSDGIVPVSDTFDFYVSWKDKGGSRKSISNVDFPEKVIDENDKINYLTKDGRFPDYLLRYKDKIISDEVSSGNMKMYSYPTAEIAMSRKNIISDVNVSDVEKSEELEQRLDTYYFEDSKNYYENGNYVGGMKDETYADNFLPLGGWYSDNYGRYFYNFGNESPIIFYAEPASSKSGKVAHDGGTYETWYWSGQKDGYFPKDYLIKTDTYYVDYDTSDVFCELESNDDYEATQGDTMAITAFISPRPQALASIAQQTKTNVLLLRIAIVARLACCALFALAMLYMFTVSGYGGTEGSSIIWELPRPLRRLPTEAAAALAIIGAVFAMMIEGEYWNYIEWLGNTAGMAAYVLSISAVAFLDAVFVSIAASLVKSGRIIKNSFLAKLCKNLMARYRSSERYKKKNTLGASHIIRRRMKISFGAIFAAGAFILVTEMVYGSVGAEGVLVFIAVAAAVITTVEQILIYRELKNLDRLCRRITYLGKFDDNEIPEIPEKSCFYSHSRELAEIDRRVRESVEEQVKAERMKIELVANVSHDLKTPLTSIISYIDLLGKLSLDDEARTYVEILDRKSQRLKTIVADVFALAKATSGVDVNLVSLDLTMLINQVLAASDDAISASGMVIKKELLLTHANVMADSDKMSRVFQNLVDNALKYSMAGTRIFIELRQIGGGAVFTIKNVSAEPINFTPDEIVERFVRGDSSRTDGGSGLGLSIAKCFTESCGGKFIVEIDGDMFKASVSMPITEEPDDDNFSGDLDGWENGGEEKDTASEIPLIENQNPYAPPLLTDNADENSYK